MSRIALLIGDRERMSEGNYLLFANDLLARGHEVYLGLIDALSLHDAAIETAVTRVAAPIVPDSWITEYRFERVSLCTMDLVWVLALGARGTFLDKAQLLFNLARDTRVVNSVESLLFLKSKYFLARESGRFPHPETHASSNWEHLLGIVNASDGKWVLKPAAGSFGRDVFIVSRGDTNLRALLQNMTANDKGQYAILQRHVAEIAGGEKRVLIVDGEPMGQYLRQAVADHRTNVHQGAALSACTLTPEERRLCDQVGTFLKDMGAVFAGIDLVYPYLIEVNVVSPGGIESIRSLTGEDLTGPIVERILAAG